MSTSDSSVPVVAASFTPSVENSIVSPVAKQSTSAISSNGLTHNFQQTLLNLQALSGQRDSSKSSMSVKSGDDDIVILDDTPAPVRSAAPKSDLFPVSLLPKITETVQAGDSNNSSNMFDIPKSNKFEINDKVRSSLKDIMSKIQPQDTTPSLGNLLASTKHLGTEMDQEERDRKKREIAEAAKAANGNLNGGNLFENFTVQSVPHGNGTKLASVDVSKNIPQANGSVKIPIQSTNRVMLEKQLDTKEPDVILLDDPVDTKISQVKTAAKQNCDIKTSVQSDSINDCVICIDSDNSFEQERKLVKSDLALEEDNLLKIESGDEEDGRGGNTSPSKLADKIDEDKLLASDEEHCDISIENSSSVGCTKLIDSEDLQNSNEAKQSEHNQSSLSSTSHTSKDVEVNNSSEIEPTDQGQNSATNSTKDSIKVVELENSSDIKPAAETQSSLSSVTDCAKIVDSKDVSDVIMTVESQSSPSNTTDSFKSVELLNSSGVEHTAESQGSISSTVDSVKSTEVHSATEGKCADEDIGNTTDSNESEKFGHSSKPSEISNIVSKDNDALDRKRPLDSPCKTTTVEPKRSRLDMVIGKLGTQIGIPIDDVPDVEMTDTEESPDSDESTETSTSTATEEEDEEEVEASPPKVKVRPKKRYRVTEKELESMVRAKMEKLLQEERKQWKQETEKRLEELQTNNDMWKTKYKLLEKKILDVTVLQQTHEKRKAKTAALRQISTKNIGIQVDETKANMMSQLGQGQTTPSKSVAKTPPRVTQSPIATTTNNQSQVVLAPIVSSMGGSVNGILSNPLTANLVPLPVSQQSSVCVTVPPHLIQAAQQTTVGVTAAQRLIQPIKSPVVTSPVASHLKTVFPGSATVKSLLDSSRASNVIPSPNVKEIFDNSRISIPSTVPPGAKIMPTPGPGLIPVLVTTSQATQPNAGVSKTSSMSAQEGTKTTERIIDLTGEEDKKNLLQSTPVLTNTVAAQQQHGTIIRSALPNQPPLLLSAPSGAQIVRNAHPQAFQFVINSAAGIRPGSLLTVVSGPQGTTLGPVRPLHNSTLPAVATQAPPLLQHKTVLQNTAVQRAPRPPPPLLQVTAPTTTLQQSTTATSLPNSVLTSPSGKDANSSTASTAVHPASLPALPSNQVKSGQKPLPPKPTLKISRVSQGIVLSWNMVLNQTPHADILSYQLFAYQEGSVPPHTSLWKKVGDVKALPLPMACTLTQFQEGNKYHFAVRAVDVHNRVGPFSEPSTIHLTAKTD